MSPETEILVRQVLAEVQIELVTLRPYLRSPFSENVSELLKSIKTVIKAIEREDTVSAIRERIEK